MRFRLFARGDGSEQSRNLLAAIMLSSASVEPQKQCLIVRALRSQAEYLQPTLEILIGLARNGSPWICGADRRKRLFGTT